MTSTPDRMPWEDDPATAPEELAQPLQESTTVPAADSMHDPEIDAEEGAIGVEDVGLPPVAPDRTPVARGFSIDPTTILDSLADAETRFVVLERATSEIKAAVHKRADDRRQARIERLEGEEPTSESDVRLEAVGLANDADVLAALGGAFTAGAKEARDVAGDLLDEIPGRGGKPRASLKVGDGDGFALVVTRAAARKELSVDGEEVDDVMVAYLLEVAAARTRAGDGPLELGILPAKTYAAGVRDGIEQLRAVLAAPKFKVTALDALVTALENLEDDTLAKRLRKAYAQVEVGEQTTKLERKPVKP